MNASSLATIDARERAIILVCTLAALAFGGFAALVTLESIWMIALIIFFAALALSVPRGWLTPILAVLIPLQFYIPFANSLNLRGAFIFALVAALRLFVQQIAARNGWRWSTWTLPAMLFSVAAFVSALGAENRYAALKGIYDWLPVFAAAFIAGETLKTQSAPAPALTVLLSAGIAEALLGLAQIQFSVSQLVEALQNPLSGIVYQPNLLRDRLSDLSFNWILDGRVVPFGTFINGIDYALFLAATLALALAFLLSASNRAQLLLGLASVATIGIALLLTLKGSALIALVGAGIAFALAYRVRLSPKIILLFTLVAMFALALGVVFFDQIFQRVVFLIQRETGVLSATGRVAIWAQLIAHLPERPLFGFGLNNAISLIAPMPSMSGGQFTFAFATPESAYVATLIETGIVGFTALGIFFAVVCVRAWQNVRHSFDSASIGVFAALVAILFGNLTVAGFTTDQNGLLLGALIGIVHSITNDRQ